MEVKDEIILGIRAELFNKTSFTTNQIEVIENVVRIVMSDFDITKKELGLVVYDTSDIDMMQKYFLAKAVEGLSKNSLTTYRNVFTKFFKETGKHIKDITTEDARVYLAKLKISGLSTNYLNIIKRALSSLYQWLLEEDFITINPIAKIKSIKNTSKVKPPLSDTELEELRAHCHSKRNLALFDFMYSTGCRVSEIVHLDITDVDIEKREALVMGKGNKERTVYLSARAAVSLKQYLESRTDKCPALFVSEKEKMIMYRNLPKESIPPPSRLLKAGIEIMCRNLGKKAGISGVHPHRFRRTAATNALRRGMPLDQVSKVLGHSNISVTTIYAQSDLNEIKKQHEKFIV